MQKEGKGVLYAARQLDVLQILQSPAKTASVGHDDELRLKHPTGTIRTIRTRDACDDRGSTGTIGSSGSVWLSVTIGTVKTIRSFVADRSIDTTGTIPVIRSPIGSIRTKRTIRSIQSIGTT